jgi:hypothetical protein
VSYTGYINAVKCSTWAPVKESTTKRQRKRITIYIELAYKKNETIKCKEYQRNIATLPPTRFTVDKLKEARILC